MLSAYEQIRTEVRKEHESLKPARAHRKFSLAEASRVPLDPSIVRDIDAVREHAHALGARSLAATYATLDGEIVIDYRPGTWLAITLWGDGPDERVYMFGPDWPEGEA